MKPIAPTEGFADLEGSGLDIRSLSYSCMLCGELAVGRCLVCWGFGLCISEDFLGIISGNIVCIFSESLS